MLRDGAEPSHRLRPGDQFDGTSGIPDHEHSCRRPAEHLHADRRRDRPAIVTTVLTEGNEGKSRRDALLAGFTPAMITVTVLAAIGLLASLSGTLGRRRATTQTDRSADQLKLDKVPEITK